MGKYLVISEKDSATHFLECIHLCLVPDLLFDLLRRATLRINTILTERDMKVSSDVSFTTKTAEYI